MPKKSSLNLKKVHERFVTAHVKKEREKRTFGRPTLSEEEKRKNKITFYVTDEESQIIRDFLKRRSVSDVIRNLVLDAATNQKTRVM
ncbi:MAG: hypothetical protein LBG58_09060 [Planctomycetaceae bacterium]|jgi:hypothetical protein|nr:hypothetical protein [Planctomycetaceae bacterium]